MNQTVIVQAYSRLSALKTTLPEKHYSDQGLVDEFHSVLETLQKESGHDLSAFRIPASEMEKESYCSNSMTGEMSYTGKMVCTRSYLMMRIDGVLCFFSLSKTTVGFAP
jgi:hypothetical protein